MKIAGLFPLGLLVTLAFGCDSEPEVIDLCKERDFQSVGLYEICTDVSQCASPGASDCVANVCVQKCWNDDDCTLGPSGLCINEKWCEYSCEDYPAEALVESECSPVQNTGALSPRLCEVCGPTYCPWHE